MSITAEATRPRPVRRARALAGPWAGRGLVALGVAVIVAAVVMAAISLFGGSGESQGSAASADAPRPALPTTLRSDRLGVALVLPSGWRRHPGKEVIRLASASGDTAVALAAGPPTLSRVDVRRDAVAALRREVRGASVLGFGERTIAGLPALTAELAAVRRSGRGMRALVIAVRSSWRTYAVTVFTRARPSRRSAVETALLLASLRLSRPS